MPRSLRHRARPRLLCFSAESSTSFVYLCALQQELVATLLLSYQESNSPCTVLEQHRRLDLLLCVECALRGRGHNGHTRSETGSETNRVHRPLLGLAVSGSAPSLALVWKSLRRLSSRRRLPQAVRHHCVLDLSYLLEIFFGGPVTDSLIYMIYLKSSKTNVRCPPADQRELQVAIYCTCG